MSANYYACFHLVVDGRTVELTHGHDPNPMEIAAVDAWLAYQRQGGLRFDDITEDLTKTRGKNGRPALEAIQ